MCASIGATTPPFPIGEALAAGLGASDIEGFRGSRFYRTHGSAMDGWLGAVRSSLSAQITECPDPTRLRLVHWNIEKGNAWERIITAITRSPRLRDADLWSINEVDWGMARSGNRAVIEEMADRLRLHWVYVPSYFEFTKGPGPDADAPGENQVGLHGIALLSRWPLIEPRFTDLPDCFDHFRLLNEKRYGHRRLLWATVQHPRGGFRLATTHLEVRNQPSCRARQMAASLTAIPEGPCWFAGDWNTHTFRRGGVFNAAREFLRLVGTPVAKFDAALLEPWKREPLFAHLEGAGFRIEEWNDGTPTAQERLSGVEELSLLPNRLADWVSGAFRLRDRTLRMRLDWISARGPWRPPSSRRSTWTGVEIGPMGLWASDHAPIGIEAEWGG